MNKFFATHKCSELCEALGKVWKHKVGKTPRSVIKPKVEKRKNINYWRAS